MASSATISIKIPGELKTEMESLDINWSECIREAVKKRIEAARRQAAAEKFIKDVKRCKVPEGFVAKSIREDRDR